MSPTNGLTFWSRTMKGAADITSNEPEDVAQGFMEIQLATGRCVRGRVQSVWPDENIVCIGDRPANEYLIEISMGAIVAFEFTDPTSTEYRELGLPDPTRGRGSRPR